MPHDDLFARAERAWAETQQLRLKGQIRAEETLKMLHQSVVRYEDTMQVLGRAIERLVAAERRSVVQRILADAKRNRRPRVLGKDSAGETDENSPSGSAL